MVISNLNKKSIKINIDIYDEPFLPADQKYIASIEGNEYAGIVCYGSSIGEVVKEIGISLHVLELYRSNIEKNKK